MPNKRIKVMQHWLISLIKKTRENEKLWYQIRKFSFSLSSSISSGCNFFYVSWHQVLSSWWSIKILTNNRDNCSNKLVPLLLRKYYWKKKRMYPCHKIKTNQRLPSLLSMCTFYAIMMQAAAVQSHAAWRFSKEDNGLRLFFFSLSKSPSSVTYQWQRWNNQK